MTTHTVPDTESTSIAIVTAVADAKGVDPTDLDACLYDHIDPCALDTLFDSAHSDTCSLSVTFEIAEFHVTVDNQGEIVVTPTHDIGPSVTRASS